MIFIPRFNVPILPMMFFCYFYKKASYIKFSASSSRAMAFILTPFSIIFPQSSRPLILFWINIISHSSPTK